MRDISAIILAALLIISPLAVAPTTKFVDAYWNKSGGNGPQPTDIVAWLTLGVLVFQGWIYNRQRGLMRDQLEVATTAANAAKASADAIPKSERAFLFLDPKIEHTLRDHVHTISPNVISSVSFNVRNYGRTPAVVEEVHVTASFWPSITSEPEMAFATGGSIPKGLAVSPGDDIGPLGVDFPLRVDEKDRAEAGDGTVLMWGKIVYRDVFGERHETGFCRAYKRRERSFRMYGTDKLNYYT